jgi:NitT/TauT family transport system substrate-binding protein
MMAHREAFMSFLSRGPHHRWAALASGVLALAAFGEPSLAQTKIQVGCTATTDCASAMVAVDQGIFAKHGLDAQMVLVGINSNIPAAIVSNSIQFGGPTASVFLQAVDGGLDLVGVAGASSMDPIADQLVAAMARTGSNIKEPKDFIGKKVGAPGIGAFLQVLFVKWLTEKGVDPKQVNFVEVTFPTMNDTLKSGAVDAVLTAGAFIDRIKDAGNGYVAARYEAELARTDPIILYATTRDFADKNPEVIKNFRAAIAEGAAIVNADRTNPQDPITNDSIAKFTKLPIALVKANKASLSTPDLKPAQMNWWLDVMKQQGLLQTQVDPQKIVLP